VPDRRWKFSDGLGALARRIQNDDGAAAIPFVLALPLLITIIAVTVQYAMLVAAYTVVAGAAEAAARSAVVSLPDGNTDPIKRAAFMVLAPLSPQGSSIDPEGQDIADAFSLVGMTPSPTFASRYTYAMQAAQVTWDARDYTTLPSSPAWVQVQYQFQLTIPWAATLISFNKTTVGGINARFAPLGQKVQIMTSPSRKTASDDVDGPALQ
jgi:Flp pilus assembly protein TadG